MEVRYPSLGESGNDTHGYCRNPNDDPEGPWCYVQGQNDTVIREYCQVPFCGEPFLSFTHCSTFVFCIYYCRFLVCPFHIEINTWCIHLGTEWLVRLIKSFFKN